MVVDERRRQRQDRSFDPFLPHSLDLARQIEEGRVQTEVHSANFKVDAFALLRLTLTWNSGRDFTKSKNIGGT